MKPSILLSETPTNFEQVHPESAPECQRCRRGKKENPAIGSAEFYSGSDKPERTKHHIEVSDNGIGIKREVF